MGDIADYYVDEYQRNLILERQRYGELLTYSIDKLNALIEEAVECGKINSDSIVIKIIRNAKFKGHLTEKQKHLVAIKLAQGAEE